MMNAWVTYWSKISGILSLAAFLQLKIRSVINIRQKNNPAIYSQKK